MINEEVKKADFEEASTADPLIAALEQLGRYFGVAVHSGQLKSLALDGRGRLPFHQLEHACDLSALQSMPYRSNSLPSKDSELPCIVRLDEGDVAILFEREGNDYLAWQPGMDESVWTDKSEFSSRYAGTGLTVLGDPLAMRESERPWDEFSRRHWFWSELRKAKRDYIPVLWASAVINLLALALPLFTMNVYDRVLPNRAISSLWVLASGVLIAFAIEFMLRQARAGLLDELGRKLDLKLSERIFSKLLNLPLSIRKGSTGSVARRVSEFEIVRDFFASTTVVLLVDMAFLFIFLIVIALIAGWLVFVPLTMLALMITAGAILQRRMSSVTAEAQADSSLQHSLLVESITGTETLKSCAAEGQILGRWSSLARMGTATAERLRRLNMAAVNLASVCQQLTSIGLIIGCFYLFDAGVISMGAIIAIVMLAGRSLAPAGQLAFVMARGKQAMSVLNGLDGMMEQRDERQRESGSLIPTLRDGEVKFSDVNFAYGDNGENALQDINLHIQPGERVAIIGRVAAGKSTLGRLLCGLQFPDSGSVAVDGVDNRQYNPQELRSALRYVGQDSHLFSGSIKDNLLLGAPDLSDEELMDALRRIGADQFIGRDAGGFDRSTGEGGTQLSGGQRGFLILARAFANPAKLIFLDEPTGAMDMATERLFVQKLRTTLSPEQTLVVSTHRQPILQLCDRLIVMENGRIIADGPREQLMAKSKLAEAAE